MSSDEKTEKTSRRFWLAIIVSFFAIDFTLAIVAISMARGDPSFRSVPGCEKRTVQWAEHHDKQRNFVELGLKIEFEISQSSNEAIVVRVKDSKGNDVSGLSLCVEAFHYTRATEQQKHHFVEQNGVYRAPLRLHKPGLWHVEIDGQAFGLPIWTERTLHWSNKQ